MTVFRLTNLDKVLRTRRRRGRVDAEGGTVVETFQAPVAEESLDLVQDRLEASGLATGPSNRPTG